MIKFAVICAVWPQTGWADSAEYQFDIPRMRAEKSLKSLALHTGSPLLYSYSLLKNVETPAISGRYTIEEALDKLLTGSGFEGHLTSRGVITIVPLADLKNQTLEDPVNNSKLKTALVTTASSAILATSMSANAQSTAPVGTVEAGVNQAEQARGLGNLKGRVILSGQSVGLQGAEVIIKELDKKTYTNERGEYNLSGVPAGNYNLVVSYLGVPDSLLSVTVSPGQTRDYNFVMGEAVDEIIVVGTRATQASSLSKQRAADNIASIVSSDVSGKFPDNTVAESLRRVPGISFARTERGGEGKFISIRGLDAGLNNVQVNGINSAIASGGNDRRVPFDTFSSDGIGEVIINKTLLPEHEGEGIGGSVQILSKTPFATGDGKLNLQLEARPNEFRGKTGYRGGGSYTKLFGADDQFGVTVSGSYRKRYIRSYQFDVLGEYKPRILDPRFVNSDPQDQLDLFSQLYGPDFTADDIPGGNDLVPEDMRSNVFDNDRENIAGGFGLEWQVSDKTNFLLQGNYGKATEKNLRSTMSFDQSDRYDDDYDPMRYYGSGPEIIFIAEVEDEVTENTTLSFIGTTDFSERTSIRYGLGWAEAKHADPNGIELNFRIDDLQRSNPYGLGGPLVPEYADTGNRWINFDIYAGSPYNIPQPILTDLGWQATLQPGNIEFEEVDLNDDSESDKRTSVFFDVENDFSERGSWLTGLKWGGKYEISDRKTHDYSLYNDVGVGPDGTFLGLDDGDPIEDNFFLDETNLVSGTYSHSDIGTPIANLNRQLRFNRAAILAFGRNANNTIAPIIASGEFPVEDDYRFKAKEDTIAAYAQAKAEFGDLMLIGGARLERVTIKTDDQESSDNGYDFVYPANKNSYTSFLPRIQMNYRYGDNTVVRGGFFTATARPDAEQMGQFEYRYDEVENGELDQNGDIREANIFDLPNPDLKPAYSYNFDLGVEHYWSNIGVISGNVFYKRIDHFLFDGFKNGGQEAYDDALDLLSNIQGIENFDPDPDEEILISVAQNGEKATVYGVELNLVRQFDELPGFWGGLGVFANLTLQSSEATLRMPTGYVRKAPFFNAPDYVGTAAVTYEKYGFDGTLSYSFQGTKLEDYSAWLNTDEYKQKFGTLDLAAKYDLPWGNSKQYRVFLNVSDITNNGDRPTGYETIGTSREYLDDIEFSGREWRFGIIGQW